MILGEKNSCRKLTRSILDFTEIIKKKAVTENMKDSCKGGTIDVTDRLGM